MPLTILGDHPFALDGAGRPKSRIATIFTNTATLVTLPGVHVTQRMAYTESLNTGRTANGLPPLTPDEECAAWATGVDLITDGEHILIRPDLGNMPLAFEADLLLQELVSKRNIRFLFARQEEVQQAIRRRGEYWRISPLPQSPDEIAKMIARSRIAIQGKPIYFYSMVTGTRFLTLQQFAVLGAMDDTDLARHLQEVRDYAGNLNHMGHPELDFFAADDTIGPEQFVDRDFLTAAPPENRDWHRGMVERFRQAVSPDLREDLPSNPEWRNRMFTCLVGEDDATLVSDVLRGINPEFFLQIRWLPGGRIEDGELMFDPVYDEADRDPQDPGLKDLCDEYVKGFICNYVREFGNLEYVNIGRVAPALRRHTDPSGHRAYIAEVKHRETENPAVRFLRLQKWGIREHLDEQKDLLRAIMEAEEYTEYIQDRRLGCWQLGMPLPGSIMTRRVAETYFGANARYRSTRIWTTYFERDYIEGVATDKIPGAWYLDAQFCLAFAKLLGAAAAPNLVVGRMNLDGKVIFDDGDEVLVADENGMPREIVVADHTGTFRDEESPLERFIAEYARPVLSRWGVVANPEAFAGAYVDGFAGELTRIQDEYRRRRREFDTLFKHSKQDKGALAWRWTRVLARLDQTDVASMVKSLRAAARNRAR